MLPPLPTIDFDAATLYPEVGAQRTALARGDWPAVRTLWDQADGVERSELLSSIDHLPHGRTTVIDSALAEDPADPVAAVLAARRLIADARTMLEAAPGRVLSAEHLEVHLRLLIRAEAILTETTARHPANVAAWEQRIVVAHDLRVAPDECGRRYHRLARLTPHHLPGQLAYLQALVPPPGGDWAPVHTFARERMLAAPAGAHNGVLVAVAHLEHFLWLPEWDIRPLRDAREQLYKAAHRSVWHPGFTRTFGWAHAVNVFAAVFALIADRAAADGLFATLGPIATEYPWARFTRDPAEAFRAWRGATPQ